MFLLTVWKNPRVHKLFILILFKYRVIHFCFFVFTLKSSLDPEFIASEPFYWRVLFAWISATVAKLRYYFAFKVGKSILLGLFDSFVSPLHYAGGIWIHSSIISTVRPIVHTNPSRKRSFSKTLFKPEEFENAGVWVFVWTENILKHWSFLKTISVTIIMWFPWPRFPQTQIQNSTSYNRWLLRC